MIEYILLGYRDSAEPSYFSGRYFISGAPWGCLARARRWKSLGGIKRFIASEKASGTSWDLRILPVERSVP